MVNDAISLLDVRSQQQILHNIKTYCDGRGVIWIGGQPNLGRNFDQVLVIEDGKIAEQGEFEQLSLNGKYLPQLLAVG